MNKIEWSGIRHQEELIHVKGYDLGDITCQKLADIVVRLFRGSPRAKVMMLEHSEKTSPCSEVLTNACAREGLKSEVEHARSKGEIEAFFAWRKSAEEK